LKKQSNILSLREYFLRTYKYRSISKSDQNTENNLDFSGYSTISEKKDSFRMSVGNKDEIDRVGSASTGGATPVPKKTNDTITTSVD